MGVAPTTPTCAHTKPPSAADASATNHSAPQCPLQHFHKQSHISRERHLVTRGIMVISEKSSYLDPLVMNSSTTTGGRWCTPASNAESFMSSSPSYCVAASLWGTSFSSGNSGSTRSSLFGGSSSQSSAVGGGGGGQGSMWTPGSSNSGGQSSSAWSSRGIGAEQSSSNWSSISRGYRTDRLMQMD